MNPTLLRTTISCLVLALAASACDDDGNGNTPEPDTYVTDVIISGDADVDVDGDVDPPDTSTDWRLGVSASRIEAEFADCLLASPLVYESPSRGAELIVVGGDVVVGVDPATGATRWVVELEEQDGLRAFAAATPAMHDGLLVVGYALRDVGETVDVLDPTATGLDAAHRRASHWMAVVDLEQKTLDERFPAVELTGALPGNDGGEVPFAADHQFLRSEIGWWGQSADSLGLAYATFGNVRDLQPWHGWVFELDLDAWSSGGTAISGRFVTTPEEQCGAENSSGSYQRLCGGGLWAPSGSIAIETDNERGFDLLIAPGNGQLDLERNDYANTLLRLPPGMDFDPGCDAALCADFDADRPSYACIESCENVFVPRLLDENDTLVMPDGRCDGLEFFECWAAADYIGGSTPLLTEAPGGERVLVYPTKDGHAYLVDADHLGTLYDRVQVVNYCGTLDDPCLWSWSGMIVSEPIETTTLERPLILIPGFMPDSTNPAGVVAFELVDHGEGPRLERRWEFPSFSDPVAIERFRRHPGRVQLATFNGLEVAIVTETSSPFSSGRNYILRASDGALLASTDLLWSGSRFVQPAYHDGAFFMSSCQSDSGRGTVEIVRMTADPVTP